MSEQAKLNAVDVCLLALYQHATEHQESLLSLSSSISALVKTLDEKIPGFEEAFESNHQKEKSDERLSSGYDQLNEMKVALAAMRRAIPEPQDPQ